MKTAGIFKKSVLNPGKNWISLLNSAKIIKKNAVTPVNFHLYHYAANNPIRYIDPDGRRFNRPLSHIKQTDFSNPAVYMGTTPSGSYIINESGEKTFLKRNTIFNYGCLFTEVFNNASSSRKNYAKQHNIPYKDFSLPFFASNDEYFVFEDSKTHSNESDANMNVSGITKLFEDVSGRSIKGISVYTIDQKFTNKNMKDKLIELKQANKSYTVIGKCMGHYFTILDCDDKGNISYSMIHDPKSQIYYNWYKNFKAELEKNGVDTLIVIEQ